MIEDCPQHLGYESSPTSYLAFFGYGDIGNGAPFGMKIGARYHPLLLPPLAALVKMLKFHLSTIRDFVWEP